MFKKLLFLSFCCFSTIFAHSTSIPNQENLQVGRYQMILYRSGPDNTSAQLYLLDTATGQLWKSTTKNNWVEHDHWQLQISMPPELF